MPVLEGPAIDSTLTGPAHVYVNAGTGVDVATPPWSPPDLDDDYDPTPAKAAPRIELEIGRAVTRTPVGFLQTAVVEDWGDDVEILAGYSATATASTLDPLWELLALNSTMSADGRMVHQWDPKGYMAWVYRDGQPVATYLFSQPIDIGGGRVALPMVGPQEQWSSRILGRAEQVDLLDDRGSFEAYDTQADMEADGWIFSGCTGTIEEPDGVLGSKAVRLNGDGWLRSPRVNVQGADGFSLVVSGQVNGKWSATVPEGEVVAFALAQRTEEGGVPYQPEWSLQKAALRPDVDTQWTEDPLGFGARLQPGVATSRVWSQLRSFGGGRNAFYDLNQLRLSVQTGFPPGTYRDLAYYVERIHRDLVSRNLGGYPDGLRTRILSLTGTESSQRWSHASRTQVRDVFAAVIEAEGGPECRITTGWWLEIAARIGSDRQDITLSNHDIVNPGWAVDPFGQIDDFIVGTGRGDGVNALLAIYSTPRNEQRWRVVGETLGPVDRTLNEIEAWKNAHGRVAARLHVTAAPRVPWHVADQITTGDTVWVCAHDGNLAVNRKMRVLRRQYINDGSLLCQLTLGEAGA